MRRRGGSGDWQFQLLPRPCRKDEKLQQAETNSRESAFHLCISQGVIQTYLKKRRQATETCIFFVVISYYFSIFQSFLSPNPSHFWGTQKPRLLRAQLALGPQIFALRGLRCQLFDHGPPGLAASWGPWWLKLKKVTLMADSQRVLLIW